MKGSPQVRWRTTVTTHASFQPFSPHPQRTQAHTHTHTLSLSLSLSLCPRFPQSSWSQHLHQTLHPQTRSLNGCHNQPTQCCAVAHPAPPFLFLHLRFSWNKWQFICKKRNMDLMCVCVCVCVADRKEEITASKANKQKANSKCKTNKTCSSNSCKSMSIKQLNDGTAPSQQQNSKREKQRRPPKGQA